MAVKKYFNLFLYYGNVILWIYFNLIYLYIEDQYSFYLKKRG